jgi:HK97 family phage portal protein
MKIIDSLLSKFGYEKQANRVYQVPDNQKAFNLFGQPTEDNYENFLNKYADTNWVYACVFRMASKSAGLHFKLFKKVKMNGEDTLEQIQEHPLLDLLETPNPFMDGADLIESTFSYRELTGNAYWLLDSFVAGKPTEIFSLNPAKIIIKPSKTDFIDRYVYHVGQGKSIELDPAFILHFKYFNPNDIFYGLGPLSAGRLSSDSQKFGDQYNLNFFKNSAEPGGVFETDKSVNNGQIDRIRASWDSRLRGVAQSHRPIILEGGLKWKPTEISKRDMQFIESKKMTREDILGVFGVPPALVGVFEFANYANSREQRKIFWIDTMIPKMLKIESVINSFLVKPFDKNLVIKFDFDEVEILKENAETAANVDEILTRSGIVTINEVRKRRREEPVEWGDVWNAPLNLFPITDKPTQSTGNAGTSDDDKQAPTEEVLLDNISKGIEVLKNDVAADESEHEKERKINDKLWYRYKLTTESWERRLKPILRSEFTKQERTIIRNLRDHGLKELAVKYMSAKKENRKQKLDLILPNKREIDKAMKKAMDPVIEASLVDEAKQQIDLLDLGIIFDVKNPLVVEFLNDEMLKKIRDINATTLDALRKELRAAIEAGESIRQAEKRIEQVFDIARGYRTERIARTSIISASNKGAIESYRQSGVVDKKKWISSRDNLVRVEPFNHLIDGEAAIKIDETFSNGLQFPGDPSGEAGNVINCRCTLKGIVAK